MLKSTVKKRNYILRIKNRLSAYLPGNKWRFDNAGYPWLGFYCEVLHKKVIYLG